jgi:pyrimidine-nucleoside phosphorylase
MLTLAGRAESLESARKLLYESIKSGAAYNKFKEFIKSQGGDIDYIENTNLLPHAQFEHKLVSDKDGFVEKIAAEEVGISSLILGAGRETKESKIDLAVGILLNKKVGEKVQKGDTLATIYGNDMEKIANCSMRMNGAFSISRDQAPTRPLIYGVVTEKGIERM